MFVTVGGSDFSEAAGAPRIAALSPEVGDARDTTLGTFVTPWATGAATNSAKGVGSSVAHAVEVGNEMVTPGASC